MARLCYCMDLGPSPAYTDKTLASHWIIWGCFCIPCSIEDWMRDGNGTTSASEGWIDAAWRNSAFVCVCLCPTSWDPSVMQQQGFDVFSSSILVAATLAASHSLAQGIRAPRTLTACGTNEEWRGRHPIPPQGERGPERRIDYPRARGRIVAW